MNTLLSEEEFKEKVSKILLSDINSLDIENKEFIKYSDEFYEKNKGVNPGSLSTLMIIATWGIWYFIVKRLYGEEISQDIEYCKRFPRNMRMGSLYNLYKDEFMFDTDKEMPLFFHKGGILSPSRFLITNKNFYYSLTRTKKIRDTNYTVKGKIFLGDIKLVDAKPHTTTDSVSIIINSNLIGVFNAFQERRSADVLVKYLSGLALRGDSLITSVEQVPAAAQTKEADSITKIKQLKDLLDQGALSEEEFNTEKQKLLKQM